MVLTELMAQRDMTKYRLAMKAKIPHATLNDICNGKTKIEKCSAETVYKLASALNVSMETLTEDGIRQSERERAYECGLPEYLQHDLDAYKKVSSITVRCSTVCGVNSMVASIWRRSAME